MKRQLTDPERTFWCAERRAFFHASLDYLLRGQKDARGLSTVVNGYLYRDAKHAAQVAA